MPLRRTISVYRNPERKGCSAFGRFGNRPARTALRQGRHCRGWRPGKSPAFDRIDEGWRNGDCSKAMPYIKGWRFDAFRKRVALLGATTFH
jgi:hypothetical protein